MQEIRCKKCNALLFKGVVISVQIKCRKCSFLNDFSTQTGPFGYWLAGFTDGEGYFAIGVTRVKSGSKYKGSDGVIRERKNDLIQFHPIYRIGLRSDDYEILESIQRWLGFGKISCAKRCNNGPNHRSEFYVQTVRDAIKLVDVFDKYPLQAKKRYDYEIWRKAVKYMFEKKHLSDVGGIENLLSMSNDLKDIKEYSNILNKNIINDPNLIKLKVA